MIEILQNRTGYDGNIALTKSYINIEDGLVTQYTGNGYNLSIDHLFIEKMATDIIKDELKRVDLDLDYINKMMDSYVEEDRKVAEELLYSCTRYVVPLINSLKRGNIYELYLTIRTYINNNKILSKEIL